MECGQALGMCTFPLALIHKKSHPQVSKYYNVSLNFYERFGDLWGLFFWGTNATSDFPLWFVSNMPLKGLAVCLHWKTSIGNYSPKHSSAIV